MKIDKQLLDTLSSQAKANPRLRQAYDLRNGENDNSQRMLNALEPGTELPIHRHLHTSESVAMLRGKAVWIFYDDQGHETSRHLIEAEGKNPGIVVPMGQWHSLDCLESGTVVFTMKDGAWELLAKDEIMG